MKPLKEVGQWTEQTSSSGKRYYYNRVTEVSQWEKPEEWKEAERKQEEEHRRQQAMYNMTTQHHQPPMPPPLPHSGMYHQSFTAPPPSFPPMGMHHPLPPPPPPAMPGMNSMHSVPPHGHAYSNPYGPGPMAPINFMVPPPQAPTGPPPPTHHSTPSSTHHTVVGGGSTVVADTQQKGGHLNGQGQQHGQRDGGGGKSGIGGGGHNRDFSRDARMSRDGDALHTSQRYGGGGGGGQIHHQRTSTDHGTPTVPHQQHNQNGQQRGGGGGGGSRESSHSGEKQEEIERNRKRVDDHRNGGTVDEHRPPAKIARRSSPINTPVEKDRTNGGEHRDNEESVSGDGKQSGSQPMDIDDDKGDVNPYNFDEYYDPDLAKQGWRSMQLSNVKEDNQKINEYRLQGIRIMMQRNESWRQLYSARSLSDACQLKNTLMTERLKHLREQEKRLEQKMKNGSVGHGGTPGAVSTNTATMNNSL